MPISKFLPKSIPSHCHQGERPNHWQYFDWCGQFGPQSNFERVTLQRVGFHSIEFQRWEGNESTITSLDFAYFSFRNPSSVPLALASLWCVTLQEVLAVRWVFTPMALGRHSHARWSCGTWAGKCSAQRRRGNWCVRHCACCGTWTMGEGCNVCWIWFDALLNVTCHRSFQVGVSFFPGMSCNIFTLQL